MTDLTIEEFTEEFGHLSAAAVVRDEEEIVYIIWTKDVEAFGIEVPQVRTRICDLRNQTPLKDFMEARFYESWGW